uniref:2'-5' oligoadenylate synthase n=1 Tax=Castor canadensis TaxID=51338 RepID=A0A8B7VTP0_CASCN|nr:2'-5'-oligoadenylate synthase-like protein 2 [Castor canadensis]
MEPFQDLYETPGDRLDAFLEHSLQPQGDWKEEGQDVWRRMERFFREQCFRDELVLDQEISVLKVVKGGSSGKGTTLNHCSDQDMVLFLSCFSSFEDQAQHREAIINFIEEKLDHCRRSLAYNITVVQHREGKRVPRSLTLQVQPKKNSDTIRVDVLLAFDALESCCLDSKPAAEIYENLITTGGHPGEFSSSFTELQRHFVKSRPVKLKNLLRLVKFWYLKYVKCKYGRAALPPKYALELLTIYAWEMGTDKSDNFNMDEGLVAVMKLLRDYEDICIYWTKYYDFQNKIVRDFIKQQLKSSRPIILDPADPTNNLGKRKGWNLMAKEAVHCLRQVCCLTEDPSQSWRVQRARDVQVTVKQTGKKSLSLLVNPYSPIWKMKAEIKRTKERQLRLSFQEPGGERQLLSSQKTLAYYGIFSKVNIRALETLPPEIQVFVKDSSGQSKPYAIHPDDTILDLKNIIEGAGGPYVEDQKLMFQGRQLKNHCILSDLQIEDCDTIVLIRRS